MGKKSIRYWGIILKSDSEYYPCWYNKLQFLLLVLSFLAFGIGDTITCLRMIEQKGITGEANLFIRYFIINYGISYFILTKIVITLALLLLPFFIIDKSAFWIMSGYLVSYIIAGTLGMVLNLKAANNETIFLSPEQAMVILMISVMLLTSIGDEIDKRVHPKIRPYLYCLLKELKCYRKMVK